MSPADLSGRGHKNQNQMEDVHLYTHTKSALQLFLYVPLVPVTPHVVSMIRNSEFHLQANFSRGIFSILPFKAKRPLDYIAVNKMKVHVMIDVPNITKQSRWAQELRNLDILLTILTKHAFTPRIRDQEVFISSILMSKVWKCWGKKICLLSFTWLKPEILVLTPTTIDDKGCSDRISTFPCLCLYAACLWPLRFCWLLVLDL